MSSSIQMKEGMGQATINEQPQGMIIKSGGSCGGCTSAQRLDSSCFASHLPDAENQFFLKLCASGTDFIGVSNYGIANATLDWTVYRQTSETLSIATRHGGDF